MKKIKIRSECNSQQLQTEWELDTTRHDKETQVLLYLNLYISSHPISRDAHGDSRNDGLQLTS